MTPCFHPRLVNGPFQDPALYIDFLYQNRAVLFDIGDITGLCSRYIHRVNDVFVSHTHMDHFIGLDHLVRLFLGRHKRLNIYGPPKIIDNVAGKLSAYTWNLVDNYEGSFEIQVTEMYPDHLEMALFQCRRLFEKERVSYRTAFNGVLLDEEDFCVRSVLLDHFTPCLAFCFEEKFHINIKKDRLDALDLPSGPWLRELKVAIRQAKSDDYTICIMHKEKDKGPLRELTLGWIKDADLFSISQGQKIAYAVDIGYTEENISRLLTLIEDADYLFCEAAFLDEDRDTAARKCHLTAYQAGQIAKMAHVRKLIPFHFSPRYQGRADLLYKEAEGSFTAS